MIKAIIFDCFGVLTTESFDVFRSKYFSSEPEKRKKANELMDRLNAAQIEYSVFLKGLSNLSGVDEEKIEKYLSANHCQGAKKAGMKSVWYKDFFQMKADLEKILSSRADN
jgi:FMN phosphatase YigB (HAD superfamily)